MDLPAGILPAYLLWAAHALYGLAIVRALHTAPWRRLASREMHHVFLGSCVALLLVWSMKAGITPGLTFHLLGGTLLVLMFGWQFALIGISSALMGLTLFSGGDWHAFSVNALLMGGIPIVVTYWLVLFAVQFLPHHFFVYVIVNAYLCGGLTMGLVLLASTSLLLCCGPYSFSALLDDFLPVAPLMILAEGFFTGMLAAGIALMRPEWIWTFDDRRYLAGK